MKKAVFIVNPISGGKSKERIVRIIDERLDGGQFSHEIIYTRYAGHGIEIARDCDADLVVAVGGDGTVSEVARGLIAASQAGNEKCFGIIPCGSGDGLALHLGISRNPKKAVDVLNHGIQAKMDYGTVNGKPFFCTTGVGFDADVAQAFASSGSRGLITYITTALKLWKNFKPGHYIIQADSRSVESDAAIITVGNVNQWGNQARITPDASVCDGLMDLSIVRPFRTWNIPRLAILLMTGKANKAREMLSLRAGSIRISRKTDGAAHFDGDPASLGLEIDIETHASALDVMIPADKKDRI